MFYSYYFIVIITVICVALYTVLNISFPFVYAESHLIVTENVFFRKKKIDRKTIVGIDDFFPVVGVVRIRFQSGESIYFFAQSYRKVQAMLEGEKNKH